MLAVAALVLAATGLWAEAIVAAVFAVLLGGVILLNKNAAKRLADRLHAAPAASEPFTFVADAAGTHDASATGASDLAWSRYTAVSLDDDLILLTMQGGAVRVLPIAALTAGPPPAAVVDQVAEWIALGAGPHHDPR